MSIRKFSGAIGAAAALTLLLATANPVLAETVLTRGFGASPASLDPQINFGAREAWIQDDIYEGLVAFDAKGDIIPGAAANWAVSDDGTTYTFHLRDNLKWSNGDPLVAQDFVNGVIRMLDPATGSQKAYYLSSTVEIEGAKDFVDGKEKDPKKVGISAPDTKTVLIKLVKPAPFALRMFGTYQTSPIYKPALDKFGKDFIKPENFVGNGAFFMTENVPQSHVTLVKNKNYWNAANVQVDKVVYQVTEDTSTELKRYLAGELDTTNDIPIDKIAGLKKSNAQEVRISHSTEILYLSFNTKKPPFDNAKLREALSLAIDRDVLQDKIVRAFNAPNYSFSAPLDPTYAAPKVKDADLSKADRIALAKKLYAEAGFGPDKPLKVQIESETDADLKKQAEGVAVMWKQILGVQAKVNAQEFQAWYDTFNAGGWDVFNDDFVSDFAEPEGFLTYIQPKAANGYSWQGDYQALADKVPGQYQELLDKALLTSDKDSRYKLLAQAERLWLDDYLTIPLANKSTRNLVKPYVKGWENNAPGWHPSRFMQVEK